MYVGIDAVGLQTLLLRRVALRFAVVDEEAVAVEFNATKRSIEQIVGADVVKKLFEERVFFSRRSVWLRSESIMLLVC